MQTKELLNILNAPLIDGKDAFSEVPEADKAGDRPPELAEVDAVELVGAFVAPGVLLGIAVRVGDGEVVDGDILCFDALADAVEVHFAEEL